MPQKRYRTLDLTQLLEQLGGILLAEFRGIHARNIQEALWRRRLERDAQ